MAQGADPGHHSIMRLTALAADYDGTLARDGRVGRRTLAALERLLASDRRLILITGRRLEELLRVFPRADLSRIVVAENGALLYSPASKKVEVLGPPPPGRLVRLLERRGVTPLAVGRGILATSSLHREAVESAIRDLGLDFQAVFNRDSLMVLPSGIDKASGLKAALGRMGLSAQEVAGVGDAENDLAFLALCGLRAAVANALSEVKERADLVLSGEDGEGVIELIHRLIEDDPRGPPGGVSGARRAPSTAPPRPRGGGPDRSPRSAP